MKGGTAKLLSFLTLEFAVKTLRNEGWNSYRFRFTSEFAAVKTLRNEGWNSKMDMLNNEHLAVKTLRNEGWNSISAL